MTTTTSEDETSTAFEVAERFLDDLEQSSFDAIERHLAPDVWFRGLLARSVHESKTATDAVETLRSWTTGVDGTKLLDREHHSFEGREHLRYRFLLRPDWEPDQWHVMEQTGFCRVKDGKITRLDLVCTGYYPVDEPEA